MKKTICYLLTLFMLISCEYQVHDNFIEVKKPTDEIEMGIELNVDNDGKQIILSETAIITYKLYAPDNKKTACIFELGNKKWELSGSSGQFVINREEFQEGDYTLKCKMYVSTGSGSIADQVGSEAYIGDYSWPVKIVTYEQPSTSVTAKANKDGFLEISWEKPVMNESRFDYYRVMTNSEDIKIEDVNQTSYIYKSYVGQYDIIQVQACFNGDIYNYWSLGSVYMEPLEIRWDINVNRTDYTEITWNNPYKSVVNIEILGELYLTEYDGNSLDIPHKVFGSSDESMTITFLPFYKENRVEGALLNAYGYIPRSSGVCIAPSGNWPRIGYNLVENALYVTSYGEIINWLLPEVVMNAEYNGPDGNNINSYAMSLYNSKMAAQHHYTIDLTDGKDMKNVKTISCDPFDNFTGGMTLTKDNKLMCFGYKNGVKGLIYNAATGKLESQFDLPDANWNINNIQYSVDANYIAFETDGNKLVILSLDNNYQVINRKELDAVNSWCFNPLKSEEIYVGSNGKIQVYDCNNLSVKNSWNYPSARVENIDPATGYLLLSGSGNAQIINPATNQQLYTLPVKPGKVQLLGNTLLSDNGYALNLNKYLQ